MPIPSEAEANPSGFKFRQGVIPGNIGKFSISTPIINGKTSEQLHRNALWRAPKVPTFHPLKRKETLNEKIPTTRRRFEGREYFIRAGGLAKLKTINHYPENVPCFRREERKARKYGQKKQSTQPG